MADEIETVVVEKPRPGMNVVITRHFLLLVGAIVVEAIIFILALFMIALPNPPAWQAAAFLLFFLSFL